MDKVKPLKIENDGSQVDYIPTETNPTQDLLACLGLAFKNSDLYQLWLDASNIINFKDTDFPSGITLKQLQNNSIGGARLCVRGTWNGSAPAGTGWLGPNDLLSGTPFLKFSIAQKVDEMSFSNVNSGVSCDIKIYKGADRATSVLQYTWQIRNKITDYVSGVNISFAAGDVMWVEYVDQGTNASDMCLDFLLSRVV